MRIQPIDVYPPIVREQNRIDSGKPVMKSRLRKLFDRSFTSALRIYSPEKIAWESNSKDGEGLEFEPTSVCLAKMVQNLIEESNEKQPSSAVATKSNCFNATGDQSSDDEFDEFGVLVNLIIPLDHRVMIPPLHSCSSFARSSRDFNGSTRLSGSVTQPEITSAADQLVSK